MKVLYACTELFPLLKTGGLADVSAALPPALQAEGCEVRRLLPAFDALLAGVAVDGPPLPLTGHGGPDILHRVQPAPQLLRAHLLATGETLYLLDAPALFHRPGGPYLDANGHEWPDNANRFALLSWVAAWLALGGDAAWQPDVVHAHDWHTGLVPLYLHLSGAAHRPPVVFTVHNLAYQGVFPASVAPQLGIPTTLLHIGGIEFHGQLSFMKAGLQYAQAITTVSPRYAQEIMTPEQGCGLDGVLRERRPHVTGILNGVDYVVWSPATDPLLDHHFDANRLAGKARNKRALQLRFGLTPDPDALLFGVVSRLSEQKGLHLLPAVMDDLVQRGGQLLVQGTGDAALVRSLEKAAARHPGKVALHLAYDEPTAHHIVAGTDVLLVPSRFEPCGLTQLYAMCYGTLPLVHAVGGLADTVTDSDLESLDDGTASGFAFSPLTVEELSRALRRAFALRRRPADWTAVQRHAMGLRFDWHHAAQAYLALFQRLTQA